MVLVGGAGEYGSIDGSGVGGAGESGSVVGSGVGGAGESGSNDGQTSGPGGSGVVSTGVVVGSGVVSTSVSGTGVGGPGVWCRKEKAASFALVDFPTQIAFRFLDLSSESSNATHATKWFGSQPRYLLVEHLVHIMDSTWLLDFCLGMTSCRIFFRAKSLPTLG